MRNGKAFTQHIDLIRQGAPALWLSGRLPNTAWWGLVSGLSVSACPCATTFRTRRVNTPSFPTGNDSPRNWPPASGIRAFLRCRRCGRCSAWCCWDSARQSLRSACFAKHQDSVPRKKSAEDSPSSPTFSRTRRLEGGSALARLPVGTHVRRALCRAEAGIARTS